MERLNYREIVEKSAKIDQWLSEIGLNQYDRIRIHKRNITELAEVQDNGTLDRVASSLAGEKRREILWSFVESIEFVDAIDASRKSGADIPKHVLEKALQGPPDPYLEDNRSNQGRNAMFEIAMGARRTPSSLTRRPRAARSKEFHCSRSKRGGRGIIGALHRRAGNLSERRRQMARGKRPVYSVIAPSANTRTRE
jgi:hypothetical protein